MTRFNPYRGNAEKSAAWEDLNACHRSDLANIPDVALRKATKLAPDNVYVKIARDRFYEEFSDYELKCIVYMMEASGLEVVSILQEQDPDIKSICFWVRLIETNDPEIELLDCLRDSVIGTEKSIAMLARDVAQMRIAIREIIESKRSGG